MDLIFTNMINGKDLQADRKNRIKHNILMILNSNRRLTANTIILKEEDPELISSIREIIQQMNIR